MDRDQRDDGYGGPLRLRSRSGCAGVTRRIYHPSMTRLPEAVARARQTSGPATVRDMGQERGQRCNARREH